MDHFIFMFQRNNHQVKMESSFLEYIKTANSNGGNSPCACFDEVTKDIIEVKHFTQSVRNGESGICVFKTKDNQWFAFEEAQDYTGHGCACFSCLSKGYNTYDECIRLGLTKTGRALLNLRLEDEKYFVLTKQCYPVAHEDSVIGKKKKGT